MRTAKKDVEPDNKEKKTPPKTAKTVKKAAAKKPTKAKTETQTENKYKKQEQKLLKLAEESGVQGNYFFTTTFRRYQMQLRILEELEKKINEDGTLVTKEYVKGRGNVYAHPAISEYNRTTDSANKTVSTLVRIIKEFSDGEESKDTDPLADIMNLGE